MIVPPPPRESPLSTDDAQALLARQTVGRLAYAFGDHVDIAPIHYVYEDGWLYGRTNHGTKLAVLARRPQCALEVTEPADDGTTACVVVRGTFHLLDPEVASADAYDRAVALVRAQMQRAFAVGDPVPQRASLFRIRVEAVSGRRLVTAPPIAAAPIAAP
jgi:nitroimidazol reductase NimA-like FMN-containing flavoprotein (pyridoxamine 5'-phosphate oxidase superfamily)